MDGSQAGERRQDPQERVGRGDDGPLRAALGRGQGTRPLDGARRLQGAARGGARGRRGGRRVLNQEAPRRFKVSTLPRRRNILSKTHRCRRATAKPITLATPITIFSNRLLSRPTGANSLPTTIKRSATAATETTATPRPQASEAKMLLALPQLSQIR